MTGEQEKGYKSLESCERRNHSCRKEWKKAVQITEKLNSFSGSLDELAVKFGDDAAVYTNNSLKLNKLNADGRNDRNPRG